jgi:hypothetical protein
MDLNFQYAHHAHDESETKSNVSPNEAVIAFDQFDWEGEVEKSNELQKCSPTLSVLINGLKKWSGYQVLVKEETLNLFQSVTSLAR